MRKSMAVALLVAVCVSVVSGCASAPVHLGPEVGKPYEVIGKGEGSAGGFMLFQFIPCGQNTKVQRAYDAAVKSRNGDALINPTIKESWFWAYVGDGYRTHIEGDVIKYKQP